MFILSIERGLTIININLEFTWVDKIILQPFNSKYCMKNSFLR